MDACTAGAVTTTVAIEIQVGPIAGYSSPVSLRAVSALAAALALTACAGTGSQAGSRHAVSTFTCCVGHDVNRVYHPGDLVTIHWIRETSVAEAGSTPTPLTLTVRLEGAFAGVAQAKTPGAHGRDSVVAQPVEVTDRTLEAPVSTLRIPAGAATGLYNLTTKVTNPHGWVSGAAIIRVTSR